MKIGIFDYISKRPHLFQELNNNPYRKGDDIEILYRGVYKYYTVIRIVNEISISEDKQNSIVVSVYVDELK